MNFWIKINDSLLLHTFIMIIKLKLIIFLNNFITLQLLQILWYKNCCTKENEASVKEYTGLHKMVKILNMFAIEISDKIMLMWLNSIQYYYIWSFLKHN